MAGAVVSKFRSAGTVSKPNAALRRAGFFLVEVNPTYRTISAAAVRASSILAKSSSGSFVAKRDPVGIPKSVNSFLVILVLAPSFNSGNKSVCKAAGSS